jgi:hypothetical protein
MAPRADPRQRVVATASRRLDGRGYAIGRALERAAIRVCEFTMRRV